MCGRIDVHTPPEMIAQQFEAMLSDGAAAFAPRFNLPPSMPVLLVRQTPAGRELAAPLWGFVPAWAKDDAGPKPINARAETVAEKPLFKNAYRQHRGLLVADGFFEWHREGGRKVPWYFCMADRKPFAFGAIWSVWESKDGARIESCAILTTSANALMAPVHDRMPVIIAANAYDEWLSPRQRDPQALETLLRPYPVAHMRAWPVTPRASNAANDGPDLIEPDESGEAQSSPAMSDSRD
jgi:putative SOS response-associated peptidase YedK